MRLGRRIRLVRTGVIASATLCAFSVPVVAAETGRASSQLRVSIQILESPRMAALTRTRQDARALHGRKEKLARQTVTYRYQGNMLIVDVD